MHEIDSLPVPKFDFAAVKARAEQPRPVRRRLLILPGLAILLPVLAAAAVLKFTPVTVTHIGGWYQIHASSVNVTWKASAGTLSNFARTAPYRIIWPSGLPKDKTLQIAISTSSELFVVAYRCTPKLQRDKMLWFVIAPRNYGGINANLGIYLHDPHTFGHHKFAVWSTGDELVRLETNCLSDEQISKVRSAMIAAGAAQR